MKRREGSELDRVDGEGLCRRRDPGPTRRILDLTNMGRYMFRGVSEE